MLEPKIEKILKRADGSRVKIIVRYGELYGFRRNNWDYDFKVFSCEKRKRTWMPVISDYDYGYRQMDMANREKHRVKLSMKLITEEELYLIKRELWTSMKPEPVITDEN